MKKNLTLKVVAGFGLGVVLAVIGDKIEEMVMEKQMEKQILEKASEMTFVHPFANLK